MKTESELHTDLARIGRLMLIVGLGATAICVVGVLYWPQSFYQSYLWAFIYWLNLALGLLALLMLQHLVGGTWGAILRGVLEGGARTIPFLALFFIPVCFGIDLLYTWAHWTPEEIAHEHTLQHKAQYLNTTWYIIRAIVYFTLWTGLVWLLMRWSSAQRRGGNPTITRWLAKLSGVGMLIAGVCVTFASIDWVMSLEPHWYSTIYGLLYVTSAFVTGMAFAIIITAFLNQYEPLGGVVTPSAFQDLGSLLLAFVIIWTYMAFSQFLIIWSGDIVEELQWYLRRLNGGWGWLALFLLLFHFVLPFFALLSKRVKRDPKWLALVAALVLVAHLLNDYWLVVPGFQTRASAITVFDFAAPIAIGGWWLWLFCWQLRRRPTVLIFERSS